MGLISDQLHPVLHEDFEKLRAELEVGGLQGTRWLLTGATGMIPAYMVRFLSWLNEAESLGMQFHLWVRSVERARAAFPWSDQPGEPCTVFAPDWESPESWKIPDIEFIVHAASPATPAACLADPHGVELCNVAATRALLDKAGTEDLRKFLFFSSSEVYGDTEGLAYPGESALGRLDPSSPRAKYPLAKREGEALLVRAFRERGLPVNIARIFHTYGPGMDLQNDGRVFADFIGNVVRGEDIILKSDGSGRRAFCYVRDTVGALMRIILQGRPGSTYNVGNPEAILSVAELADLLIRLSPNPRLERRMLPDASPQSLSAEVFPQIEKLRNLGWHPQVNPQDGFARTIQFHLQ